MRLSQTVILHLSHLARGGVYAEIMFSLEIRHCALLVAALFVAPVSRGQIGVLPGDPLTRLGLSAADLKETKAGGPVKFSRLSRYLDNVHAVVTHTMDDSHPSDPQAIDAMDKYGIKTTIFVSTAGAPIAALWPRLLQAIENGHEIGAHSRRHRCTFPPTAAFCDGAYADTEVAGARDDILKNTPQPYVWSWAYPCGLCADMPEIRGRLASAGYLVARTYPGESEDRHVVPDLQTWAKDPYAADYTQIAQKQGGTVAKSGRTDVAVLNAKFDEVYKNGGIYSFMTHAMWLEFGPEGFYERHMAHIGGHADIWYVPMGPLYAYRTLVERTKIRPLAGKSTRFAVYNDLDPKIFNGSVTLECSAPAGTRVTANGRALPERGRAAVLRWTEEFVRRDGGVLYVTVRPNTVLEFQQ
jgi:peptidoglycan/xylan/chitin deacetylase (PgdA/CDA1 family)